MNSTHILKRPLILTEKGNNLRLTQQQYWFEVALDATKHQVKHAVETSFPEVHVVSVRTMVIRGKHRRMGRGHAKTANWKKAIVTLREGETIEHFATE